MSPQPGDETIPLGGRTLMRTRLDPLALLERPDKWYLGGGKAAMYAPAFPKYLDTPGFWDEAYFADIRLERLFCVLALDESARPLTLRCAVRRWTPDRLTQIYTVEGLPGLRLQEERVVTPNDTLACRLTISNSGTQPVHLHLLLWSLQAQRELPPDGFATTVAEVRRDLDALSFAHCVRYGPSGETPAEVYGWGERRGTAETAPHCLYVALGGSRLPDSWTVNLAEGSDTSPLWQVSVFPEKFRGGRLAQEMQAESGWNPNGLLHLALHYVAEAQPGASDVLTFGASPALDRATALANLRADMTGDVVAQSRQNWEDYFASVPYFECSDPYLERCYWYRWYGLRLLTVDMEAARLPAGSQEEAPAFPLSHAADEGAGDTGRFHAAGAGESETRGQLPYSCVFEGIGAFRSHISYSAPCHMRENSWRRDPALAMGALENFLANQVLREGAAEDGFLPGHLYLWRRDRGFYHADWGAAALQVYYLTGDRHFVRRVYPGLVRYTEYFDRERDRESVGLYDVIDQGETGQEYMSRYLFADESADRWRRIQVKGVDATCYLYSLQRALAVFARALGQDDDARWWEEKAARTREAVRALMWDPEAHLFKDVHPQTLRRSPYKAAVGFYPFLSDIATEEHLAAWEHLNNPATFGTPYPVPASSVDDPYFDAEAEWKGKRTNCPWNGRVWPMTNSHAAEALARAARTLAPGLRPAAAELIGKFVRLLFHDGDPKRPNCYEHYNPYTGMPCLYRGVDDYQHSWIVDLILKHVVGVQPEPGPGGTLVIDPLPFGLESFRAEGIPVRGHLIDVLLGRAEGFVVRVDDRERVQLPAPERVEITL
ncbi:MAG TPA: trehalase family glycosidase [Chthonomonadaceae bacterium]|nr:trehalase family glycosidase [Chthonomonadaceae bacterium]